MSMASTHSSSHGHTSLPSAAVDVAVAPSTSASGVWPAEAVVESAAVASAAITASVCSSAAAAALDNGPPLSRSTELTLITGVTLCLRANERVFNSFLRLHGLLASADRLAGCSCIGDVLLLQPACCCFSGDLLSGDGPRSKSSADDTDGLSTVCCGVHVADDPRRLSPPPPPRPQLRRRRPATESDWLVSSALAAESYAAAPLEFLRDDDDVDNRRSRSSAMDIGSERFLSLPSAKSHGHTSSAIAACGCCSHNVSSQPLRLSLENKNNNRIRLNTVRSWQIVLVFFFFLYFLLSS